MNDKIIIRGAREHNLKNIAAGESPLDFKLFTVFVVGIKRQTASDADFVGFTAQNDNCFRFGFCRLGNMG